MAYFRGYSKCCTTKNDTIVVDLATTSGVEFALQQNIVDITIISGIEGMTARHALVCLGRTLNGNVHIHIPYITFNYFIAFLFTNCSVRYF